MEDKTFYLFTNVGQTILFDYKCGTKYIKKTVIATKTSRSDNDVYCCAC